MDVPLELNSFSFLKSDEKIAGREFQTVYIGRTPVEKTAFGQLSFNIS